MSDIIKDYMNAFLGIIFLGIPLLGTLLNQRSKSRNRKYRQKLMGWVFAVVGGCLILTWVGIDKINRDNSKDQKYIESRENDSIAIKTISIKLDVISNNYKKDTSMFSDFKKRLESIFYIRDSGNVPVPIHNYKPVFNTNVGKVTNLKVG